MARALLEGAEPNSDRWSYFVEQLRVLGQNNPVVASVASVAVSAAPKPIELFVTRFEVPKRASELSTLERKQLQIAWRGWAEGLDADARFAADGSDTLGTIEITNIADAAGDPLYDAMTCIDQGVIFRAATTEEIGWVVQGGVELKERNDALRVALKVALGPRAARLKPKKS